MSVHPQPSHAAMKMMVKYPGHMPVVCLKSDLSDKRKLLVPSHMKGTEFLATVRDRCEWAERDCSIRVADSMTISEPKEVDGSMSFTEIYGRFKSPDAFLYVTVGGVANEQKLSSSSDAVQCGKGNTIYKSSPTVDDSVRVEKFRCPTESQDRTYAEGTLLTGQPTVFHLPDNEHQQPLSEDVRRARKILKKYPDRVPVLVKQAATLGLPHIDKKLLVPKGVTCAGLKSILPKHLGISSSAGVAWDRLTLSMGDVPLKDSAHMSEVYNQYVDENDGGLHITLSVESHTSSQVASTSADHVDLFAATAPAAGNGPSMEEVMKTMKLLEEAQLELEKAHSKSAAAQERASEQQILAAAQAERAFAAEGRAVAAEDRSTQLGQLLLRETQARVDLQATCHERWQASEIQAAFDAQRHETNETKITQLEEQLTTKEEMIQCLSAESEQALEKAYASLHVEETKLQARLETTDLAYTVQHNALVAARAEAERLAKGERKMKETIDKLTERVEVISNCLVVEQRQREFAEAEAKKVIEELVALKKAQEEKKLADEDLHRKLAQRDAEDFVHLGWDRGGFPTEHEEEDLGFELLVSNDI